MRTDRLYLRDIVDATEAIERFLADAPEERFLLSELQQSALLKMNQNEFVEQKVTYILETDDGIVIIENVPARVSVQTGERLFAPEVVEQLQEMIWRKAQPKRVVQTPVYEFAA